jgi:hypothetical protein
MQQVLLFSTPLQSGALHKSHRLATERRNSDACRIQQIGQLAIAWR